MPSSHAFSACDPFILWIARTRRAMTLIEHRPVNILNYYKTKNPTGLHR
jgi:hypothetical protein